MAKLPPRYVNRELSWLEFNQRVLDEACDSSVPLLERLKFLAITSSNLDEFFMVRVGSLYMLTWEDVRRRDPAGLTPKQQIAAVSERCHRMVADQYSLLGDHLNPAMRHAGIRRVQPEELTPEQYHYIERFYNEELSAVLTPMAVGGARRFPILQDLQLHILVRLFAKDGSRRQRFAVIPVGTGSGRFLTLPGESDYEYALREDAVKATVQHFFPGERIAECAVFRITRNAGMSVDEDGASDLLAEMEEVLRARKYSACIRLEVEAGITRTSLRFLMRGLKVSEEDVYEVSGPPDLASLMRLAELSGFDALRYEPWPPQSSPDVDAGSSMLGIIAKRPVLLLHPYQSFGPVVRLIQEAARDPDVLAIKQTLYRTSRQSPIIEALREAAQNGKYVTVVVELKARFDEARNIGWARQLEQEGVQVVHGVKDLKVHAKICLIVRREQGRIVRYLHLGTGNYNESTATLYSDVSYMLTDEAMGRDASALFNAVAGYSTHQEFLRLAVAPLGLRERLLELIRGETERRRQGLRAGIMAKMNSLVEPEVIEALYEASCNGVDIQLNIRGICCLRPGVPGVSENIRVVSIIDRFLEHSRIFHFVHGGEERVFISSADWMPRNLRRRVELLVPIDDPEAKGRLKDILETTFEDARKGRVLTPDGTYRKPRGGPTSLRTQQAFYDEARDLVRRQRQRQATVLTPHLPGGER